VPVRLDVGRAVLPGGVVAPASVLVEHGLVVAAGAPASVGEVAGASVVARPDLLGVPGFVDLQVNGAAGVDFGRPGGADWDAVSELLAATGVTACCPTIPSAPPDAYGPALDALGAWASRAGGGADGMGRPRVLGVHLEGPFLNPARRGAHPPEVLANPDPGWVSQWLDGPVPVAIVTLAPELTGASEVVRFLAGRGVVVSAGHTEASYERMVAFVGEGGSMVTHLFNGQAPLHHREPGVVGAALALDGLSVGIILDGVHVHEGVAAAALRSMGERGFVVTDAVAGPERLADGTLAGSHLSMDDAFRRAVRLLGLARAVEVCGTTPARAVGRPDLGVLAPGAAADLVLLDDDLSVVDVWVAGAGPGERSTGAS